MRLTHVLCLDIHCVQDSSRFPEVHPFRKRRHVEIKFVLALGCAGHLLQCVGAKLLGEVQGIEQPTHHHVMQWLGIGGHDAEGIVAILAPVPVAAYGQGMKPVMRARLQLGDAEDVVPLLAVAGLPVPVQCLLWRRLIMLGPACDPGYGSGVFLIRR